MIKPKMLTREQQCQNVKNYVDEQADKLTRCLSHTRTDKIVRKLFCEAIFETMLAIDMVMENCDQPGWNVYGGWTREKYLKE
jgi:hypothetical protein